MKEPMFPHVRVELIGANSNVYNLMAMVAVAMRREGVPAVEITKFRERIMTSGSYDEALQVMMETVDVV